MVDQERLGEGGPIGDERSDGLLNLVGDIVILVDHWATPSMRGAMTADRSPAISSQPIEVFLIVAVEAPELALKLAGDAAMFCLDKFQRVCVA
jgi:hypothetical protein